MMSVEMHQHFSHPRVGDNEPVPFELPLPFKDPETASTALSDPPTVEARMFNMMGTGGLDQNLYDWVKLRELIRGTLGAAMHAFEAVVSGVTASDIHTPDDAEQAEKTMKLNCEEWMTRMGKDNLKKVLLAHGLPVPHFLPLHGHFMYS
jgi:hypothetical protein